MSAPLPDRFHQAWKAWNEMGAVGVDLKDDELFVYIAGALRQCAGFNPWHAKTTAHLVFIDYCKSVLRKDQELVLMHDPPLFATVEGVEWLATKFDEMGVPRGLMPDLQDCKKLAALITLGKITYNPKAN